MATPKKTIHDIKLPVRKADKPIAKGIRKSVRTPKVSVAKTSSRVSAERARVRVVKAPVEAVPTHDNHKPRRRRGLLWIVVVALVILGAGAAYGALFYSAVLSITPKHSSVVAANTPVVFAKEPSAHQVPLVVMSLSDTVTKTVRSTGSTEVSEKASGDIIVYNNFSTAAQKLIEETRFETPDGKIYKTGKGTTTIVPGITNGKPGQVQVKVYAAEAGDIYNKEPSDFTIPGFKGTPKYTKLYARSVGPITGGFVGTRASLPADEQQRLTTDIGGELGDRLKAEALLQKTDEFIILDQASKVSIADPKVVSSNENPLQATLSVTGTFSTILVNKKEFARELASQLLPGYQGEPISIKNIEDLTFSVVIPEGQDLSSLETLSVMITGEPLFIYTVSENELVKELQNLKRKQLPNVLAHYDSIDSAKLIIKPFWRTTAPGDADSIKIKYNID